MKAADRCNNFFLGNGRITIALTVRSTQMCSLEQTVINPAAKDGSDFIRGRIQFISFQSSAEREIEFFIMRVGLQIRGHVTAFVIAVELAFYSCLLTNNPARYRCNRI